MFLTQEKFIGVEEQAILALSKKIKLNLPKGTDVETRIERIASIQAHHLVQDAIKKHGEYIDGEGNKASSLGGLTIQINKRIKRVMGASVSELVDKADIKVLRLIREAIAAQFHKCEALKLLRSEIKERVYSIIEIIHDIYSLKEGRA